MHQPHRRKTRGLLRALMVLLTCLGLAAGSLAATTGSTATTDPGAAVLAAARSHVGDAYAWGQAGPRTWDCSGLTSTLWREVGGVRGIPRVSRDQHAWAKALPAEQALPGDLVFFGSPVTHVGIVATRTTRNGVTSVTMVDASSSQKGVVERTVWKSAVVRYGRVPRPGMTPIQPWTPPAPPAATPQPPAASPTASPGTVSTGKAPLAGLAHTQQVASSTVARRATVLARAALGNQTFTDIELIRNVWRRAGGGTLPSDRAALTATGHRVSLSSARVGDLIVYGPPTSHVGIYMGGGLMISASKSLGQVVQRQVWASGNVQLVRLDA